MKQFIITLLVFVLSCNTQHEPSENLKKEQKEQLSEEFSPVNEESDFSSKSAFSSNASAKTSSRSSADAPNDSPESLIQLFASSVTNSTTDTMKYLLKTATIKFRTKSVVNTTLGIERIVNHIGGYVQQSNIESQLYAEYRVPVSADSVMKIESYTVSNQLVLRIPSHKFDEALLLLMPYVEYLDERFVEAKNVRLTVLANQLQRKRIANYNSRLSRAADKSNKLADVADVESSLLNQQERADNTLINDLELNDRLQLSTVVLTIYQDKSELCTTVGHPNTHQPSFLSKTMMAFRGGLATVGSILLWFFEFWWFIVIAGAAFAYYRWRRNRG